MENFNSLSLNDLRSLTGGVRIYGSNGYAWTDKHGHWHYTVTKGAVDTVFGIIGNGWGSAGASGRQHQTHIKGDKKWLTVKKFSVKSENIKYVV